MREILHTIEKILGIYRWHPTIALRYLPMVKAIEALNIQRFDILEVGSGGLGIVPYLRKRVVGVDITFPPPLHPDLVPVRGEAQKLPFTDNSFDIVVSTDMLEHLNKADRRQAISEMLRVGRKLVCIGVPVGKLAQAQDQQLANLYKEVAKKEFEFFSEHDKNGLPEVSELEEAIKEVAKKNKKQISFASRGTLNLSIRYFLMQGWISQNLLVNIFFRKALLFAIPLMRHLNQQPTYRQIFFITIHD